MKSSAFETAHNALINGSFEGLAPALESLARSGNVDRLCDPTAYPKLMALPAGIRQPLVDRVVLVNRAVR